jgi:hypothetical protein
MSISSVGGKTTYTTSSTDPAAVERRAARSAETAEAAASIADHVAALDEQEPIRSTSTTRGTLVDTYL